MNALVIGYGSIGKRHVAVLKDLGLNVSVVSRRGSQDENVYQSIKEAFQNNNYDYIVIANETVAHFLTFKTVAELGYGGKLLIEKPLFLSEETVPKEFSEAYVAYNLRFHPLIDHLKNLLGNEEVINVNAYVGQYLPDWRPNTDYTKTYSAFPEQGGGVLRDLSHELDYLMMIFGEWKELIAVSSKISNLDIQSEDHVQILYKVKNSQTRVALELNYLDRIVQRYMTVQTNTKTIRVDFIANTINCNGEITQLGAIDRNYTYEKQHKDILGDAIACCDINEGLKVMKMINAIEKSSKLKEWVCNG